LKKLLHWRKTFSVAMPKRSQRASQTKTVAAGAEAGTGSTVPVEVAADEHFVVVRISKETLGFRMGDVAEIIRLPRLASMPLGPQSLLGLANLRGLVLPVLSLRRLLGVPDAPPNEAARVVVIDRGAPVGFVVDRIEMLLALRAERIETDRAGAGRFDPDLLDGVVKGGEGETSIKILNTDRLLRGEFNCLQVSSPRVATVAFGAEPASRPAEAPRQKALVSFDLGSQEYALPLDCVREIIPLPGHVAEVAASETAVLGVVTLRDRLLPLVSLRALLGMPVRDAFEERGRVVVLSMGNGRLGMVADRTREILRIDPAYIDPAPALLTRGAGEAEIDSICRLDEGRRLVAVLSPERLFRSDLVRRVLSEAGNDNADAVGETAGTAMAEEQFIIFRLGDQEYGLPIAAVEEVARPPKQITRLPKAPGFIDGVINLRGRVVPVVDLRRRFEIASQEPETGRRILVLVVGGRHTGFMVDAVSEVLKVPAGAIRPAPELSAEQMRLIGRVVNLDAQGRIILLVDPTQLLDQVEADLLAKFDRNKPAQAPTRT
jgi:purine-binding chemotaxis protein CheW